MTCFDDLRETPGTYILALEVFQELQLSRNNHQWTFDLGYYLYFGSAKGKKSTSLGNRLERHYKKNKQNSGILII